jgi:ribosome maturation factor RimP
VQLRWLECIQTTVEGLGYELVDFKVVGRGLFQVFIDIPFVMSAASEPPAEVSAGPCITVEDCEKVSKQLCYVFEVEHIDYERLEVSSPGLDRPLKKHGDFIRFAGCEAKVTLKKMVDGCKQYRGILQAPKEDAEDVLILNYMGQQGPAVLHFTLGEIERAQLVAQVDFRSSKR